MGHRVHPGLQAANQGLPGQIVTLTAALYKCRDIKQLGSDRSYGAWGLGVAARAAALRGYDASSRKRFGGGGRARNTRWFRILSPCGRLAG